MRLSRSDVLLPSYPTLNQNAREVQGFSNCGQMVGIGLIVVELRNWLDLDIDILVYRYTIGETDDSQLSESGRIIVIGLIVVELLLYPRVLG